MPYKVPTKINPWQAFVVMARISVWGQGKKKAQPVVRVVFGASIKASQLSYERRG